MALSQQDDQALIWDLIKGSQHEEGAPAAKPKRNISEKASSKVPLLSVSLNSRKRMKTSVKVCQSSQHASFQTCRWDESTISCPSVLRVLVPAGDVLSVTLSNMQPRTELECCSCTEPTHCMNVNEFLLENSSALCDSMFQDRRILARCSVTCPSSSSPPPPSSWQFLNTIKDIVKMISCVGPERHLPNIMN